MPLTESEEKAYQDYLSERFPRKTRKKSLFDMTANILRLHLGGILPISMDFVQFKPLTEGHQDAQKIVIAVPNQQKLMGIVKSHGGREYYFEDESSEKILRFDLV